MGAVVRAVEGDAASGYLILHEGLPVSRVVV